MKTRWVIAIALFAGGVSLVARSFKEGGNNSNRVDINRQVEQKLETADRHSGPQPIEFACDTAAVPNPSDPSPTPDVVPAVHVADGALSDGLQAYPLPEAVTHTMTTFAAQNDILILGEVHGTQEIPALAGSLIPQLSKLGYGVLALEVGHNELEPINAWATGESQTVPEFFAKPLTDGRGNIHLMSLIRFVMSPPNGWKLICFDQSLDEAMAEYEELQRKSKGLQEQQSPLEAGLTDEAVQLWQKRDAAMAANFASQLKRMEPQSKVLAICGGLHNRIENRVTILGFDRLWPSFAAVAQRDNPAWKIGCINIQFHGGGIFNAGRVIQVGGKPIDQAEAHPAIETGYHWELNLPHATPALFLAPPEDPKVF